MRIPGPSAHICLLFAFTLHQAAQAMPTTIEQQSPTANTSQQILIRTDADRNGTLDSRDDALQRNLNGTFDWKRGGAFLMANLDDDDQDGTPDASDDVVNGNEDFWDLAEIEIALPRGTSQALPITLTINSGSDELEAAQLIRLFQCSGASCESLDLPASVVIGPNTPTRFAMEAKRFAGPDWDGLITIQAEAQDRSLGIISAQSQMRVSPWLAISDAAPIKRLYAATGAYRNQPFLGGLGAVAKAAGFGLVTRRSPKWQDMWVQDTFEMGHTVLPGRSSMHVVLNGVRGEGLDDYGRGLLAPQVGFVQIGLPRGLTGGDTWADWMGNLSVSPATAQHPHGRIYYGENPRTGIAMHPDILAFLRAQELQKPFALDTSFLVIKHVDEIASFITGPQGQSYLVVASPVTAATVTGDGSLLPHEARANRIIEDNVRRIQAASGLHEGQIIRVPVTFSPGGASSWSNPANSLFANGTLIIGKTNMPAQVQEVLKDQIESLGVGVFFIDDSVYQNNGGNVHCATNAMRVPGPFLGH